MKKRYPLASLFILLSLTVNAQLTGITPNQGLPGQYLSTTITGNNIFIQTGSPAGNIYEIRLINGPNVIPVYDMWSFMFNVNVLDPNTVTADFTVPLNAVPGVYSLEVTTGDPWNPSWNQSFYSLPAAFTVTPPDGYVSGKVFDDLNQNGIYDAGEPGISSRLVTLMPLNLQTYPDGAGNYSIPVPNGNYQVILANNVTGYMFGGQNPIAVTVNNANSTGNNFALTRALISVTPDFGYRGMTKTHQIVSQYPIFNPGGSPSGNVSQVLLLSSPYVYATAGSIVVIDSFTVQFSFIIPGGASLLNNLHIRIYTNANAVGYHYLYSKFDILQPPVYVSGTAFFDQNQNKLYDAGEPGINGAKFFITPDSSIAFSNYQGNYTLGSLGGQQVLSNVNTIPGLVLFTDSVTYTFNATGTITGKNFGFISTAAPYSIQIKDIQIFPRCNSQQYVYFKVRNYSNTYYNTRAWIKRDPQMTFISSPIPPSTISADTIFWDISNLAPYSEFQIAALFQLPGVGSSITFVSGAHALDGSGNIQQTASVPRTRVVFCAYDPNDKQVTPPGILAEHYTLMSDTLDYLIRFQNTGNDTAFNVVVVDTLEYCLDYTTFEMMGSSHSVKTEIEKNGVVTFTMNNILLPDSNINEAGSHGYLNYRIRAKSGLPDETPAKNTAYIYFDFNPAVITNTTNNLLVYVLPDIGPLPVELLHFSATPGDEQITLKWITATELNNDYFTIGKALDGIHYEELGRVQGAGTSNNANSYKLIDKNPVEGLQYYQLTQTDYNGDSRTTTPIAVRWMLDADLLLYPNPSSGELFLIVPHDFLKERGTLLINDADGRIIISKEIDFEKSTFAVPLLTATERLSAGSYIVHIVLTGKTYSQLLIVR